MCQETTKLNAGEQRKKQTNMIVNNIIEVYRTYGVFALIHLVLLMTAATAMVAMMVDGNGLKMKKLQQAIIINVVSIFLLIFAILSPCLLGFFKS